MLLLNILSKNSNPNTETAFQEEKNGNDMVLLHHVAIRNIERSPSLTHIHSYPKGQIFPFKTEQILNLKNKLLVLYKDHLFMD